MPRLMRFWDYLDAPQGPLDIKGGRIGKESFAGSLWPQADVEGGPGDDTLTEGLGVDGTFFGYGGNDRIILTAADGLEADADGGADFDTLVLTGLSAPATINLQAGTITSNGETSNFVNFEAFETTSVFATTVIGSTGTDRIVTGAGADFIDLRSGGFDFVNTGDGNDGIYFGTALSAGTQVNAGAGTSDQIGLQGNYAFLDLFNIGLTGVEVIVLLNGADNRFGGATGTNLSYNIIPADTTIASGQTLTFQANTLRAGESFTLSGGAETNGSFLTFGGLGTENLTGGNRDDGFYFGTGRFNPGDMLDGRGGTDQLGLQGNYAGANALTFGANQLTNIESIVPLSANDTRFGGGSVGQSFSYTFTMNDGNVAAGRELVIQSNTLRAGEVLTFNGAAETDGRFRVFGGASGDLIIGGGQADVLFGGGGSDQIEGRGGADTLIGNAGSDRFVYTALAHSTAAARDQITDFASGDLIDLSLLDGNSLTNGFQNFYLINSGAAFDGAGQLRITQTGTSALIEGDGNGDGVVDFAIQVTVTDGHTLTRTGDFTGLNAPPGGGIGMEPFAVAEMPQDEPWHRRDTGLDLHLLLSADLLL